MGKREEHDPECGRGPCRTLVPEAWGPCLNLAPGVRRLPRVTPGPLRSTVALTGCQSAPAAALCCLAPPEGSPGRPTARGPISSRRRLARNPGGRSLPPSTSPEDTERETESKALPQEKETPGGLRIHGYAILRLGVYSEQVHTHGENGTELMRARFFIYP